MKKIMFNDKYGLTKAVLDGRKTMTRREINPTLIDKKYLDLGYHGDVCRSYIIDRYALYKEGEVVAIAQSYKDCGNTILKKWGHSTDIALLGLKKLAGWNNKMFTKAELLPHHIRITNIRAERLQDISDEDCFREGIYMDYSDIDWDEGDEPNVCFKVRGLKNVMNKKFASDEFYSPKSAFSALIDKVCGKGTWDRNPYVFVYEFELVD